jgi:hypothetical protein
MGIKPSQNATFQEVEVGTTLDVNGTLDLTDATVTVPANTINSTGLFTAATLNVTGATEQNGVKLGSNATLTPAAGTANISNVTLQVVDGAGASVASVFNLDVWLSDAASGAGLTGTTASGTVTTTTGIVLQTYTAKKALRIQTDATGKAVLAITDTAKTGFYVAVALGGKAIVGAQLVTGNYG